MVKKAKGSMRWETEGNDRSGGWVQPRRNPTPIYKSRFMDHVKTFFFAFFVQTFAVVCITLIFDLTSKYYSTLMLMTFLISGLLTVLRK